MRGLMLKMKPATLDNLVSYKEAGELNCDFLYAVLTNDLVNSFGKADFQNRLDMHDIVRWVYNELPGRAWGTPEKVMKWRSHNGGEGLREQLLREAAERERLAAVEDLEDADDW